MTPVTAETVSSRAGRPASPPSPTASPLGGTRLGSTHAVLRAGLKPPTRTRTFIGLDIGTTKICAIIGEIDPSGKTNIKGISSTPSQGLRRGLVVDLDETIASIRAAIHKAEEVADVEVKDVLVGIAGSHIQCHPLKATVKVANSERGVTRADIRRAIDKATSGHANLEREVIHVMPQRFLIDDGPVPNPEGFCSRELTAEILVVTAGVTSAQNIIRAVRQAHYRTGGIYLEPLASSIAVLTPEERDLGVVMIDIGGGTSDFAIWAEGSVRYTGVVALGGDSITEDIRRGLKISCYDAENLKKRLGSCRTAGVPDEEMIEVPIALTGESQEISRKFLCEIIESRVQEILLMVREQCELSSWYDRAFAGVVLTGGGSLQEGIVELAGEVFNRPCKIGRPAGLTGMSSVAGSPIYATGVGLVLYGLQHDHEILIGEGNLFQKLVRFFKKAIDWY